MDVVYIVGPGNKNTDLRISLRSLDCNVTGYDNVFIAGFKPRWVSDIVRHIETHQISTKWLNAYYNAVEACRCPDVSEDFVLFNDDFFALEPVELPDNLNVCRGLLDESIEKFKHQGKSKWRSMHSQAKELLETLGCRHFYSFMLHMPMVLNKTKFLAMSELHEVRQHIEKYGTISFRTIYGNLYWSNPSVVTDCKVSQGCDLDPAEWTPGVWLSVFDRVTDWLELYPEIGKRLSGFKDRVCRFERIYYKG